MVFILKMSIKVTEKDSILFLRIDSPPVNAFSSNDLIEMCDVIEKHSFDTKTSVIIIENEGRGFSAGADKKEHELDKDKLEIINDCLWKVSNAIYNSDIPVICCCDGFVIGAGFFLPCSSDIVSVNLTKRFELYCFKDCIQANS